MQQTYNFRDIEQKMTRLWEKGGYFAPVADMRGRRPYSMFLVPPNASGALHIGNAFMIAIQDVLARYHRAKGEPTLWVPGTDHGGYETQVTFERELEQRGESKDAYSNVELSAALGEFVARNNEAIVRQTKAMGASVDWSHFRYTLDEDALAFVGRMFRKMVSDNLIYRNSYMVNYCTSCATVLADIELKEIEATQPLYFVKFPFQSGEGYLTLTTKQPEFLFAVTHALIHPQDERFSAYIGKMLINPVTGAEMPIVESKRKYDPQNPDPHLPVFSPSSMRYDFEYAIRNKLPLRNLLDWEGRMIERYPGTVPDEARTSEVIFLTENGFIEQVEDTHPGRVFLCKKGHPVQSVIRMTWFLQLDDEQVPLRKPALEALGKGDFIVQPSWRKKGLIEWIGKMHNWPIARQNVWGIRIPVWYEISDPMLFTVWFRNREGVRRNGNLHALLGEGVPLEEIRAGLERLYAAEGCKWTLDCEPGKTYLPETDLFDTWFSSSAWSVTVFEDDSAHGLSPFYPSSVIVIGHDLLRLSVARKVLLGVYLTGVLPFGRVYLHPLLKGADGQKMSKSLGNAVTLDEYLEKFGADVTRMALVSCAGSQQDFVFSDERLEFFEAFSNRIWKMGRICNAVNIHTAESSRPEILSAEDERLRSSLTEHASSIRVLFERYSLAQAQEKTVVFLSELEGYAAAMLSRDDMGQAGNVFRQVFMEYLSLLHPFMPFLTEELHVNLYPSLAPLAAPRPNTGK